MEWGKAAHTHPYGGPVPLTGPMSLQLVFSKARPTRTHFLMGLWPATTALDHSKLQGPILSAAAPHPGKTSAILLKKKEERHRPMCTAICVPRELGEDGKSPSSENAQHQRGSNLHMTKSFVSIHPSSQSSQHGHNANWFVLLLSSESTALPATSTCTACMQY